MSRTSGSDERMVSSGLDPPSIDDANSGGVTMGWNSGALKKGPWTTAEDAILVEYVTKHGEGNWNAVQKHSGLARCGKSCRLRWANHLRPDLKKGAFTPEEEHRIIELHAKMGNKWARMAAELPGRTDNEIKNYWNTRIKRRQRAGLPIYPPEICMQALNENQQSDNINTFPSGDVHNPDFMPGNNFEIPAVEFKNLELNQQIFSPALLEVPNCGLLDIPTGNLLVQGLHHSEPNKTVLSTNQPCKRLRGSESFPGLNSGFANGFANGSQYQSDCSLHMAQSVNFTSSAAAYDHNSDHATCSTLLTGSHAFPSSEPAWAMKLELPSLQTQLTSWGSPSPSSPLPIFESVDVLIQTPPSERNQSPQNSGLLDAVLYEAEAMIKPKSNCCLQTLQAPDVHADMMSSAMHDLHETEWEAYEDELSSLGNSSSSVFSESTPMNGNSIDELHSAGNFPGCKVKEEASHLGFVHHDDKVRPANQMIFHRPDFLLGSNCFGPMNRSTNDHSFTFLGDDLSRDCKQEDTGVVTSSSQGHEHGHKYTMSTV